VRRELLAAAARTGSFGAAVLPGAYKPLGEQHVSFVATLPNKSLSTFTAKQRAAYLAALEKVAKKAAGGDVKAAVLIEGANPDVGNLRLSTRIDVLPRSKRTPKEAMYQAATELAYRLKVGRGQGGQGLGYGGQGSPSERCRGETAGHAKAQRRQLAVPSLAVPCFAMPLCSPSKPSQASPRAPLVCSLSHRGGSLHCTRTLYCVQSAGVQCAGAALLKQHAGLVGDCAQSAACMCLSSMRDGWVMHGPRTTP